MIQALAYLSMAREGEGVNHLRRIQSYIKILSKSLKSHPRFASYLESDEVIDSLAKAAALHDIGSVGVPDRILLKPGRLTTDEFDVIKTHPKIGLDLISQAEQDTGKSVPMLIYAKEIIFNHHERWDGSGYPEGIFGDEIPISARLFMVADVYDALISRRVYKAQMNHQQAVKVMSDGRATLFDPDVIDVFIQVNEEFRRIAYLYADNEKDFKRKIDYLEKAIAIEP